MALAHDFPDALRGTVFSREHALAAGTSPQQLRSRAFRRHHRNVYSDASAPIGHDDAFRVLAAEVDDGWISHTTALEGRGLWVPSSVSGARHISRPRGSRATRHAGVVGHQFIIDPADLEMIDGVRTSSVARAWREAADQLPVHQLVQLGDYLVREPRPGLEGRTEPYARIDELQEMTDKYPRVGGGGRAATASRLIRVGSDSPTETDCRLAIVSARLPEPQLQIPLRPGDPYSPTADLGYLLARIAIQYEGAHHRTASRHAADMRRDREFTLAGWTVLLVGALDHANGFSDLISSLRSLLF